MFLRTIKKNDIPAIPASSLEQLPEPLFYSICANLSVKDLIKVGELSKCLNKKTKKDDLWMDLLHRDFGNTALDAYDTVCKISTTPITARSYYQFCLLQKNINQLVLFLNTLPDFVNTLPTNLKGKINELKNCSLLKPNLKLSSLYMTVIRNLAQSKIRDKYGNTTLNWATEKKCLPMVKTLLFHKADVNVGSVHRVTPLIIACTHSELEIAKVLLEKGANPDCRDTNNDCPLIIASRNFNAALLDLLLSRPITVNVTDNDKNTPLIFAAYFNIVNAVKKLIEKGAKIDAANKHEFTALQWAAINGYQGVVSVISPLSNPDDLNTAMEYAAQYKHALTFPRSEPIVSKQLKNILL